RLALVRLELEEIDFVGFANNAIERQRQIDAGHRRVLKIIVRLLLQHVGKRRGPQKVGRWRDQSILLDENLAAAFDGVGGRQLQGLLERAGEIADEVDAQI